MNCRADVPNVNWSRLHRPSNTAMRVNLWFLSVFRYLQWEAIRPANSPNNRFIDTVSCFRLIIADASWATSANLAYFGGPAPQKSKDLLQAFSFGKIRRAQRLQFRATRNSFSNR